jgi:hypothetical protein
VVAGLTRHADALSLANSHVVKVEDSLGLGGRLRTHSRLYNNLNRR